jgi:hypothetical protein
MDRSILKRFIGGLTPDQKLERALEHGSVSGVRESLPKAHLSMGINSLIRKNLSFTQEGNSGKNEEILDLLLQKAKDSKISSLDSELLELSLASHCTKSFKRLTREFLELGIAVPDLRVSARSVILSGDKDMWNALLDSGLYKKDWNDELLQVAYVSGDMDFVKSLNKLGADPTYGKTDWTLKILQDASRSSSISGTQDLLRALVKSYKKSDLRRVLADNKGTWAKATRQLCQRELKAIEKKEKSRDGAIAQGNFL